jgi:hypothetical protein
VRDIQGEVREGALVAVCGMVYRERCCLFGVVLSVEVFVAPLPLQPADAQAEISLRSRANNR